MVIDILARTNFPCHARHSKENLPMPRKALEGRRTAWSACLYKNSHYHEPRGLGAEMLGAVNYHHRLDLGH